MFTLGKFFCCGAVLGSMALLGPTILQMSANNSQSSLHGLPSGFGAFGQGATNQAGPASDRAIAEITVKLQSFSDSALLFAKRNVIAGRLQLQYMANTIHSNLSVGAWNLSAPSWFKGGPQVAAQNAGAKANELARKVPLVNGAIDATRRRFAAVRDSLSNAAGY